MDTDDGAGQSPQVKSLAVGLDIGTTYSGAHCQQMGDDDIFAVLNWPRSLSTTGHHDALKAPSRLYVDDEGLATGWGYQDPKGKVHVLEWFKLAFVPEHELPPHLRNSTKLNETKKKMKDLGIDATQVMAQYMDLIATHAFREIKDHIGQRAFESMRFHVVITIPAIWGAHAIAKMREAAGASILQVRSPLTSYEFLSEPQAAVEAYARKLQLKLRVGEIVVVVDLGGGTVDIISYLKVGEGSAAHVDIAEAVPGDGDVCGAVILDEAFQKLLLSKMPRKHKNINEKDPEAWAAIMSGQWHDGIKRNFQWKGKNKLWHVRLTNLDRKLDIPLHEDEIRDVFESTVMPKILDLIKRQIAAVKRDYDGKIPRVILPVGGFGRCPYVLQRLREVFNPSSVSKKPKANEPEIEVHSDRGEMPWGAVCRGACLAGIRSQRGDPLVKTRLSRYSVGFTQWVRASKEEGGKWYPNFDCYMKEEMVWLVKKGDPITSQKTKSLLPMYLPCPFDGTGIRCEESKLYAHDGDSPPEQYDANDPGFWVYGTMKITATKPIEKMRKVESSTGDMPQFAYNLEVELVGGSVSIVAVSAEEEDKGKVVGRVVLPDLETM